MEDAVHKLISNILQDVKLSKKEKEMIGRELYVHFCEEKRELELQGFNEERVIKTIEARFGNIQTIGGELFFVHRISKTLMNELSILFLIFLIMCALLFSRFVFFNFEPIL
jgi:hypothetical protein